MRKPSKKTYVISRTQEICAELFDGIFKVGIVGGSGYGIYAAIDGIHTATNASAPGLVAACAVFVGGICIGKQAYNLYHGCTAPALDDIRNRATTVNYEYNQAKELYNHGKMVRNSKIGRKSDDRVTVQDKETKPSDITVSFTSGERGEIDILCAESNLASQDPRGATRHLNISAETVSEGSSVDETWAEYITSSSMEGEVVGPAV